MCMYFGGNMKESTTEFLEKQGNFIIVVKNVPCTECTQDSIRMITSEITVTVIDYNNQVA